MISNMDMEEWFGQMAHIILGCMIKIKGMGLAQCIIQIDQYIIMDSGVRLNQLHNDILIILSK